MTPWKHYEIFQLLHNQRDSAGDYLQATTERRFILKCIGDMIITYSQMYCTDKYSQRNIFIWPIWLNG